MKALLINRAREDEATRLAVKTGEPSLGENRG